jgi:hypothetical protein
LKAPIAADPTPVSADKMGGYVPIISSVAGMTLDQAISIGRHRRWIGGDRRFQRFSLP